MWCTSFALTTGMDDKALLSGLKDKLCEELQLSEKRLEANINERVNLLAFAEKQRLMLVELLSKKEEESTACMSKIAYLKHCLLYFDSEQKTKAS